MFHRKKTIYSAILILVILVGVFNFARIESKEAVLNLLAMPVQAADLPPVGPPNPSDPTQMQQWEAQNGTGGNTKDPSTIGEKVASVLGSIANVFIKIEGAILAILVRILIWLMSYNDFVVSDAVITGWVLLRDIANLFFVVVLLIIAIGTILQIESYNFKRLLPKVLIMAVLVNFSRTICGLMIDAAQVVMMTFVAAYTGTVGESNLVGVLAVKDMVVGAAQSTASGSGTITILVAAGSAILAVVLILIAIMVVLVMIVVILGRIIMLWLLTVLSPLAYILSAFPQGQRYAQQWWQEFSKYVIVGPILAFFLWLTFAIAVSTNEGKMNTAALIPKDVNVKEQLGGIKGLEGTEGFVGDEQKHFFTAIGDASGLLAFVIAVGMLMGSLMITQQLGVAGGAMAGGAFNRIRQTGAAALTKPVKGAWGVTKWGAKRADDMQAYLQQRVINTRPGQWLARSRAGRAVGLERLGTHGVQLRTIPEAWRQRAATVEKQRLSVSAAVAQDILNRSIPLSRTKSDYTSLARAARVSELKHEYEASSTEQSILRARLKNEVLDSSGKVRGDKKPEAEAILEIMTKNHDLNEVLKDPELANMAVFNQADSPDRQWASYDDQGNHVYGKSGKMMYNQHNVKVLLRGMFGDDQGARVGSKLQEIGLANKDAILWGMSSGKQEGGFAFNDDETQAVTTEYYIRKRDPRFNAQKGSRQDIFQESADQHGNLHFRAPLDEADRRNLIPLATGWAAQPTHIMPETSKTVLANMDILWNEAQRREAGGDHESAEVIKRSLKAIVGAEVGEEGKSMEDDRVERFIKETITENENLQANWAAVEWNRLHPDQIIGRDAKGKPLRADLMEAAYQTEGKRLLRDSAFRAEVGNKITFPIGGASTPAPAPAAATAGQPQPQPQRQPGPRHLAVNPEAYQRTSALREKAKELGGAGLDYTAMPEYNEQDYLKPAEMESYEKIMTQKERMEEMGMRAFNVSHLAQLSSKNPSELADSRVMIDLDLSRLQDLDFINPNARELTWGDLSGDQGEMLAVRLLEELEKEKKQIMTEGSHKYDPEKKKRLADINQILGPNSVLASPERLAQIGSFQINNTAGGDEAVVHGMGHQDLANLDSQGTMQMQWWDSLSGEEKTKRQEKIERESGHKFDSNKPEDRLALAEENAAMMYANETDFGDQSADAARFTENQKRQLKAAADQAGYNLGIHIPVEVKVEPELEEVPTEFQATVSRWADKFRRKKIPAEKAPTIELTEEDKFRMRQRSHQNTIKSAEDRQQELGQMASSSKALIGSRSDEYQTAAAARTLAERQLRNAQEEQQRKKQRINDLVKQAKEAEARKDIPAAKTARTAAGTETEEYKKGEQQVAKLQGNVADKKAAEEKAKKQLTDQVQTYEKNQQATDKNKKKIDLTKKIQQAEAGLEMARAGKLPEAWSAERKAAFQKSMAEVLEKAQRELESLTVTPPTKATLAAREALQQAKAATTPQQQQAAAAKVRPEELVQAAQEEITEQERELNKAMAIGRPDGIIQALSGMEDVLKVIEGLLRSQPAANVNQPAQQAVIKALRDLRQNRNVIDSGRKLDPGSLSGQIGTLNRNLMSIFKRSGKYVGRVKEGK